MTPPAPRIVLIAAVGRNGVIGNNQGLAWRDPLDAKHMRDTTMGHPVIMGRKTWDSLPPKYRPLPGRTNIVVTRNAQWQSAGGHRAASLSAAFALAGDVPKVFVLGGGELYAQALPLADELVLTEVDADLEGDTHFPTWHRVDFDRHVHAASVAANGVPFAFVTYRRKPGAGSRT